jgi:type IV secretory pathway VirB2 component (pilin)
MTREQNLYWYGLKATAIQILGILIIVFSFWLGSIHYLWTIGGTIMGIIIIFKGKAMRFQYKMNSGNIIHRGDW